MKGLRSLTTLGFIFGSHAQEPRVFISSLIIPSFIHYFMIFIASPENPGLFGGIRRLRSVEAKSSKKWISSRLPWPSNFSGFTAGQELRTHLYGMTTIVFRIRGKLGKFCLRIGPHLMDEIKLSHCLYDQKNDGRNRMGVCKIRKFLKTI